MIVNIKHLVNFILFLICTTHSSWAQTKAVQFEIIIYQQPESKHYGSIQTEKYQSLIQQDNEEQASLKRVEMKTQSEIPPSASMRQIANNLETKATPFVIRSYVVMLEKQKKYRLPIEAELTNQAHNSSTKIQGEMILSSNLYLDLESQLALEIKEGNMIVDFDHATHRRHLKYNKKQYLDNENIGTIVNASPMTEQQLRAYEKLQANLKKESEQTNTQSDTIPTIDVMTIDNAYHQVKETSERIVTNTDMKQSNPPVDQQAASASTNKLDTKTFNG